MAEDPKKPSPAYVAYATFKNSVRGLKHGGSIPDTIDISLFNTMSGSGKNQLFGAFKFFGLLGEKGAPTPRLRELALSDENGWNKIMGAMINEHYKDQVKVLKTGTPQTLKDSFGDIGGIVKPAIRFLLAACKDTGIEVSPLIRRDGTKVSGVPRKRRAAKPENETTNTGDSSEPPKGSATGTGDSVALALLEKFPAFDPSWKPEQVSAWFAAYSKLIDMNSSKTKVGS